MSNSCKKRHPSFWFLARVPWRGIVTVLIGIGAISTIASAGSLTPPGSVSATFYTLTDIYDLINSNTTTTAGNHDFTFSDSLSGSGYTLTQIYDALTGLVSASTLLTGNTYLGVAGTFDATNLHTTTVKSGVSFGIGLTGAYPSASDLLPGGDSTTDLVSSGGNITSSNGAVEWWQSSGTRVTATLDFPTLSNVCNTDTSNGSAGTLAVSTSTIGVGNTVCGVAGELLANLFNSSSSSFPGGSQENGGIDDYNFKGPMLTDGYRAIWTTCTSGNNYCGTGDSGADAKDHFTGLIWSMRCNGSGCSSFSDASPLTYTWNGTGGNNNARTAQQLCSDHTGWYLPHQKQLLQVYIDGAYGNLETTGLANDQRHWSATQNTSQDVLDIEIPTGESSGTASTTARYIRCVRPAS